MTLPGKRHGAAPKLIWDAGGGVARGFIVSIAQKSEHPCEVHSTGNLQVVGAKIINSAIESQWAGTGALQLMTPQFKNASS